MRLVAALLLAAAAAPQPAGIGRIRAQLWYGNSARLSRDIVSGFNAWNTAIGEGDAEEPANDVLVSVELVSAHEAVSRIPLEVEARDAQGRVLARRVFRDVLLAENGAAWKALWLRDATCAGAIRVTAAFGAQRRTARLMLPCGE